MKIDVMEYLKKNKRDKLTSISIVNDLTRVNEILRLDDYNNALFRFESLLNDFRALNPILQKIIKKIIPKFERLTQHAKFNLIPRTSNQAEQEYSMTNPKEIEKKYKTVDGMLEFLALNMVNPMDDSKIEKTREYIKKELETNPYI
jgi:hypothetical protein